MPDPDAQIIDGLRAQIGELKRSFGDISKLAENQQSRILELERELAAVEEKMAPVGVPGLAKAEQPVTTKN